MTVTPQGITDGIRLEPVKDWSDLGGVVLRAARRALAVHLVEAAREMGEAAGRDVQASVDEQR